MTAQALQNPPKKVKSELQTKLELEGWRFLTNTSARGQDFMINPEVTGSFQEYLRGLKAQFQEVETHPAFDIYGNPMRDGIAVYARGKR